MSAPKESESILVIASRIGSSLWVLDPDRLFFVAWTILLTVPRSESAWR
jgi:hypothetical protein